MNPDQQHGLPSPVGEYYAFCCVDPVHLVPASLGRMRPGAGLHEEGLAFSHPLRR